MAYLILPLQYGIWYLGRKVLRSAYHPVVILCQLWFFVLLLTTVFAPDYYYSPIAYLLIIGMQVSAILGATFYYLVSDSGNVGVRHFNPDFSHFRLIVYGALFFGLLAIYSTLKAQGFGLSSLLSISGILQVSHAMSLARYEEQFQIPFLARISQMMIFFASAVGGFNFSVDRKKYRTFEYFLPIMPSLLIALILTTRAAVLFNLTFWVCANLSGSLLGGGRLNLVLITKRTAVVLVLGIAFITLMFVSLQFMRGGITDMGRLKEILLHLRQWPFGSIAGFSIWVDTFEFDWSATGGYYTLVGLFDQFGIQSRKTGLYDQYVNLGSQSWGNIYTAYRGLVQDLTLIGGMFFMAVLGFFGSTSLSKCLKGNAASASSLVAVYAFFLWTPIASFYAYTAHIGALVLFAIYLKFFVRRPRRIFTVRRGAL